MFDNCGEKIKNLGIILFILTAFGGFIFAIVLAVEVGNFFVFLGVLLGMLIAAYVEALLLAGLGELIINTQLTAEYSKKMLNLMQANSTGSVAPYNRPTPSAPNAPSVQPTRISAPRQSAKADGWICDCGAHNADYVTSCRCGRSKREVMAARRREAARSEEVQPANTAASNS